MTDDMTFFSSYVFQGFESDIVDIDNVLNEMAKIVSECFVVDSKVSSICLF